MSVFVSLRVLLARGAVQLATGYCSKCAFARARRLDIVANAHLLAHFRLLESTSTHACLVQHNNLSSRLSIVLFVCMGCVCVYLFACVHARL